MKRIILYEVARFINRAKHGTPTGIDRVDIRYFEHFRTQPDTILIGVIQKRDRLVAIPDRDLDRIWKYLGNRWIKGESGSFVDALGQRMLKLRSSIRSFLSRYWVHGKPDASRKILSPRLLRLPEKYAGLPISYVNCSHNGIRSCAVFDALKTHLDARCMFYVHDTIPIDFPEFVRAGFDARHATRMEVIGRTGDLILTNSRYSRDRFTAFCASRDIAAPPIEILHIGTEPSFLLRAAAPVARSEPDAESSASAKRRCSRGPATS